MSVPTGSWAGAAARSAACCRSTNVATVFASASRARCWRSPTVARQVFACSLYVRTCSAYWLHSSLFTGGLGRAGAAGRAGAGEGGGWATGREKSRGSVEVGVRQAGETEIARGAGGLGEAAAHAGGARAGGW